MGIPKETIETIRNTVSIEQIVSRYVPSLKQRGNNYVGLCPFHTEKTPSFTVSPDKQIYHCFGCHAGGNVFTFIQNIESVSFPESVEIVASFAGITIQRENDPQRKEADYLLRINEFAARVYAKQLRENTGGALEYLHNRGVTDESIEQFQLGYAPESWDFMKTLLTKRSISHDKAVSCGMLSRKKETGRVFDTFRDRIIFPIRSHRGGVVGFGGRVLGEGQPKYLNTAENMLFSKRTLLYGAHRAVEEIRAMGRAIVVEGYLDVVGCHQAGICNVVAPLGTALTLEQLQFLARYTSEIVLLFDSDAAGAKASLRTLQHARDINAAVTVARLPEGDPFDYIIAHGMRKLMVIVDSAQSPLEFQLRSITAPQTQRGASLLPAMFAVIEEQCELQSEKKEGCELAASILQLDKNGVLLDFEKYQKGNVRSLQRTEKSTPDLPSKYLDRSLTQLVKLLFHYPFLIEKAMIDFAEFKPHNSLLRDVMQKLFDSYENDSELTTEKLFDFFTKDEEKQFLNTVITTDYIIENPEISYTEIYINVKIHEIDGKISYYTHLLRSSGASGDSSRYLAEIDIWRREKEKLATYLYGKNSDRHGISG